MHGACTALGHPPRRAPHPDQISDCGPNDNWTCITFFPDFARFNMEGLEPDTVELMRKRVFDMSGVLGKTVKVGGCVLFCVRMDGDKPARV